VGKGTVLPGMVENVVERRSELTNPPVANIDQVPPPPSPHSLYIVTNLVARQDGALKWGPPHRWGASNPEHAIGFRV